MEPVKASHTLSILCINNSYRTLPKALSRSYNNFNKVNLVFDNA